MIPYGKQNITQQDIDAVVEVLKSDFITQGPVVEKFEEKIAQYVNAKYCAVLNSATSGLHLACKALGVTKDDNVWTTPISFVATANCALYCDANVEFVDIDELTYNLSAIALEKKLIDHTNNNKPLPKVVIVVHLAGQPCDMKAISKLSLKYGFKVIEDASHAIGSSYGGKKTGSCEYSDICVFSFHPVKIITTAEGGAVTTNNPDLHEKILLLRSHGVNKNSNKFINISDGEWYYEQIDLGFNYRMTDLQAALGISQLKRIDDFIIERNKKSDVYYKNLSCLPIKLPYICEDNNSSWHLFIIQVNECDHLPLFRHLKDKKIGVNLHYIPIYKHPFYIELYGEMKLKYAEIYYKQSISIPIYFDLTLEEQMKVIDAIKDYYEKL